MVCNKLAATKHRLTCGISAQCYHSGCCGYSGDAGTSPVGAVLALETSSDGEGAWPVGRNNKGKAESKNAAPSYATAVARRNDKKMIEKAQQISSIVEHTIKTINHKNSTSLCRSCSREDP